MLICHARIESPPASSPLRRSARTPLSPLTAACCFTSAPCARHADRQSMTRRDSDACSAGLKGSVHCSLRFVCRLFSRLSSCPQSAAWAFLERRLNSRLLPVSLSGPMANPTTRQKSFLTLMNSKTNSQGGRGPLSIAPCYQAVIERANKTRDVVLSDLLSGRVDLREVLQYTWPRCWYQSSCGPSS
jgi:hypothetical protein